ncbi:MAG: carboxymuconolactone decarboxylase family protein [Ramlibacter sp.]
MSSPYITSLRPVDPDNARPDQKAVLDHAKKQVGFIPNMYANMANVPAVLDTYLHGYDLFRRNSGFKPTEQEVVFLAISQVNGCHYCTAAHSMLADKMSGVPAEVLKAIREGTPIADPKLAALYAVTQSMTRQLGKPDPATVRAFLAAGYQETHLMNIILAISVKALSNYTNMATGTELDARFAGYRVA